MRVLFGFFLLFFSLSAEAAEKRPELVIYTYDSLVAKGGLGPEIFPIFEKKCGCLVRALASGDGGQLLTRLQIDAQRGAQKGAHPAALVLGLDQRTWEQAKPYLVTSGDWKPNGYDRVRQDAKQGPGFVPFDYGVLAFMEDRTALTEAKLEEPQRLSDLLKPEWRRNLILEDPRTSTPGLGFLLYANAVGGVRFWPKFRSQWLTLAPGWDAAYGLFMKKEAPLVWSYTTSQAYHESHGDRVGRYRALVFEEGNPMQIEGAAMIKGAGDANSLARQFLAFLLSSEVQSRVAPRNWMLPVMPGMALPESFQHLPLPKKIISTPTSAVAVEQALRDWKIAIGQSP